MAKIKMSGNAGKNNEGAEKAASSKPNRGWDSLTPEQQKIGIRVMINDPNTASSMYNGVLSNYRQLKSMLGAGWQNQTAESFAQMQRYLTGIQTRIDRIKQWSDVLGDEAPEAWAGDIQTFQKAYDQMQGLFDQSYGAWDREQHKPIMATESFGQVPGQTARAFDMRFNVEPGTPMQMFPGAEGPAAGLSRQWAYVPGTRQTAWQRLAEKAKEKEAEFAAKRYEEAMAEQERLLAEDPAALRAEADELEFQRTNVRFLMPEDRLAKEAELMAQAGTDNMDDVMGYVTKLRQRATLAERFQQQARMTEDAVNDPYFRQFVARGESFENPTWEGSTTGIQEPVNIATFARDHRDEIRSLEPGTSVEGENGSLTQYARAARMTDEERDIYSYYLGRYGKQAADRYFDMLADTLNARRGAEAEEAAEGNYAAQLYIAGKAGLRQFGTGIGGAVRAVTGDDRYVPVSAEQYAMSYVKDDIEHYGAGSSERFFSGKWWKQAGVDITQTTANMLPSILVSAAATAASEGALGPEAAAYLGEALGALTIGATAGGNAYDEMIRMGYTRDQARGYAALSGASEAGLQYVLGGVSKLGGVVSNQAVAKLIQNIDNGLARTAIQLGGEFLSEGLEEYLQDVLEPIFRNVVLYEDNKVNFLSRDAIYSGILGGMSALIMSGGGTVARNVQTYQAGLELMRAGVTAQRVADIGMTLPADSTAYELASAVKGGMGAYRLGLLFHEVGAVLTEANVNDITQALVQRGMSEEDARVNAAWLAIAAADPDMLTAAQERALEGNDVLAQVIEEVILNPESAVGQRVAGMNEIEGDLEYARVHRVAEANRRQRERAERKRRSPEANALNDQLKRAVGEDTALPEVDEELFRRQQESLRELVRNTPNEQLVTALRQRREEIQQGMTAALDAGRGLEAEAYRRVNEIMTGSAKAYLDAGQDIRALRDYINDNTEGTDYGRADVSRGDGRRDAGEGAGVEAGDVRQDGEGAVAEGEGHGVENDGLAPSESRSSRELGIRNGTENRINRPVPREAWSDEMRTAAEQAAELGYDVTYVEGAIEVVEGGRTVRVAGVIDFDSGRILVRSDSKLYSAQSLVRHEMFHARKHADPELLRAALSRLVGDVGYENVQRLIERYAEKYQGVYGDLPATVSDAEAKEIWFKYFEEIAADAYAGITRKGLAHGAERFSDTVRQLVQEREGMGNGSGGMPGETRYMLDTYSDNQIENWKKSKKIIIYKDEGQLRDFIRKARKDGSFVSKIYFGIVGRDLANKIEAETGIDVYGRNVTLRADNVRKTFESHGKESKEAPRGQRAIEEDDFVHIPDIIGEFDKVSESDSPYYGRDTIVFEKDMGNGRVTLVAVDSGSSLDLFVQTMYAGRKKESIASMTDDNSPTITSETSAGTAPNNSIPASSENSNTQNADTSAEQPVGLRSNFPDLTRWDREATARAEAERSAETPERGQAYSMDEEEDIPQSAAEYAQRKRQQLTEEQRQEVARRQAERESLAELRRTVRQDAADLAAYDRFAKQGELTEAQERIRQELRKKYEAEQAELKTREKKIRQERDAAQERAAKRQDPARTRKDFVQNCMDTMHTAPGMREELGVMAEEFFNTCMARGYVDEEMFGRFVDRLFEAGMVTVEAPAAASAIRGDLSGIRLYVPEDLRADLAPDTESYTALRREAMANGIILTSDPTDGRIDSTWAEFRDMYPGSFRASDTDVGQQLTELIDLAREGRDENVTMYEMMQRVEDNEGFSVSDQIADFTNSIRNYVEQAMYSAGIEMDMKAWAGRKIVEARQQHREAEQRQRERYATWQANENARRKEMLKRQSERRQLTEMHQRDLKGLQRLARQRDKLPAGDLRRAYDRILDQFNIYTMRMANEAQYSPKYGATFRDIVDVYRALQKTDPNWKPSKEIEEMIARLDLKAVGDLDMDAAIELHNAISKLEHEYHNRNDMLADERHRRYSDVYSSVVEEVGSSGGKGKLPGFFRHMLTKVNLFEMMGGWDPNGELYGLGKKLQAGERAMKGYIVTAQNMLRDFTRENAKWLRRADGKGRNAIWLKYELPVFKGRDIQQGMKTGNSAIYEGTVTVEMTPLERVELALEADNYHNTTHMEGGRTFADKKLYAKGKTQDAFAQGQTVALSRETVMNIIKDMSPEERALYDILKNYYNGFARGEINRVSNIVDGYDRAITENYAPEFTNTNYVISDPPGIFDLTAAGVGHMRRREQVSMTPTYNISALDAFERHVNQTARYVGLSIPIKNLNTVLNWFGDGTTTKDAISRAWGTDGVKAIEDIMRRVQAPRIRETTGIERVFNKIQSNYIGSTFAMNPKITLKQNASYPTAAAVLGWRNMPKPWQLSRIDEELINRYTPELAHRKLGYGTPEAATMKENPNFLDRNKVTQFLFRGGAITWMDAVTVRSIWPWAENYVKHEMPDLEVGSERYYRAVADAFNEAVNTTQPMYDVMNRAGIMDSDSDVVRTLTKFKTVPMQELNTIIKYAGEARYGGKKERVRLAAAIGALTASTVALEVVEMGFAYLLNGMKYYRDDDGELTFESVMKKFGKNILIDTLSIIPGGSLFYDAWTYILAGGKSYKQNGAFEIFGTEQINDIIGGVAAAKNLFEEVAVSVSDIRKNGGDVAEYFRRHGGEIRGQILHLANLTATYTGLPAENTEKYIGGLIGRLFPEAKADIDGWFTSTEKADLGKLYGDELESRLGGLLAIRGIDVDDGTAAELARLYEAGEKTAVPSDTPTSIRVNGEDVELTAFDLQTFDNAYTDAIGGSLDALVESAGYIEADDATRAKMLGSLYAYAAQNASRAVKPEYEGDKWTLKAAEAERLGVPLEAYIALQAQGFSKNADKLAYIDDMQISDDQRGMLYYHAVAQEGRREDVDAMRAAGMSWGTVYETMREYFDIDAMEGTSANVKTATFKTWAYENLTDAQSAAAVENLSFSSGMKAESRQYDKLVESGLDPETALSVVTDWGALEPEDGRESVSKAQKIREVAMSDRTKAQKYTAIGAVLGADMTTSSGEPTPFAKMQTVIDSGVDWDDYLDMYDAGAVDRWMKLTGVGVSAQGAVTGSLALAALEPEEGSSSVSDLQRMNAITESGMSADDQFAALYITASSDTERWKLDRVNDYGISASQYVKAKGVIQMYYDYNPKGSATRLDQTEAQYALANVPGLSNDQRAVLWQTLNTTWKGMRNPFNVHVGQSIYGEYESWKAAGGVYTGRHAEQKPKRSSGSGASDADEPPRVGYWEGLTIPGL